MCDHPFTLNNLITLTNIIAGACTRIANFSSRAPHQRKENIHPKKNTKFSGRGGATLRLLIYAYNYRRPSPTQRTRLPGRNSNSLRTTRPRIISVGRIFTMLLRLLRLSLKQFTRKIREDLFFLPRGVKIFFRILFFFEIGIFEENSKAKMQFFTASKVFPRIFIFFKKY